MAFFRALTCMAVLATLGTPLPAAAQNSAAESLVERRCHFAKGKWCREYFSQPELPLPKPPTAAVDCPGNCNGVGVCDYSTGRCACPSGFSGDDCRKEVSRPCNNMDPATKRDKGWTAFDGWSHSRCSGLCDDTESSCWCPPETKYGRKPAPPGSPPGTPPIQRGRPLYMCNPMNTSDGTKVPWGVIPYEHLFGPEGWCNAEKPVFTCPCRVDGVFGVECEHIIEHTCINQCSGRGECNSGFCKCHEGFFGFECGQKKPRFTPAGPGDEVAKKPWIRRNVWPVAASEYLRMAEGGPEPAPVPSDTAPLPQELKSRTDLPPPSFDQDTGRPLLKKARKRPLIYVYELATEFTAGVLQLRIERGNCIFSSFVAHNFTSWTGYTYSIEPVLHESFLLSEHRTLDPEEADFFYVPAYSSCLFELWGKSTYPRWPDAEGVNTGVRPMGASHMLRAVQEWIVKTYPKYWNRRGGRDHVWLLAHDEGACWVPDTIWPGIMLTHWGKMDFPHESATSYGPDNYTLDLVREFQPQGWLTNSSKAHPCYDPKKDLIIPIFKNPVATASSPYFLRAPPHVEKAVQMGQAVRTLPSAGKDKHWHDAPDPTSPLASRDIFFFFRGDIGIERTERDPYCLYSRCTRQTIYRLIKKHGWDKQKKIAFGTRSEVPGEYSDLIARSVFCMVLLGDGWSSRFEEAVLHGCIPVVIMDNVHVPYQTIMDVDHYSVRVRQDDLADLMKILGGMTEHRVLEMQANLHKVWQRYRYNGVPLVVAETRRLARENLQRLPTPELKKAAATHPGTDLLDAREDAFTTIMQFLYSRIEAVHKGA